MGTPRLKGFWAGLCIVAFCHLAFCHPVFSAQNNERNKPTLAKENATDHSLQDESREAGPTLPNPVKSKSSKKKTASYAEAPRDAAQKFPSNRTDSQPTDKLTVDNETLQFGYQLMVGFGSGNYEVLLKRANFGEVKGGSGTTSAGDSYAADEFDNIYNSLIFKIKY